MLSTGVSPQWLTIISTAALFSSLCAWAFCLYYVRVIRTEYPSKTLLNKVQAEIDSLSGDIGDLTARFSRFQKREGMAQAREAKRSSAELQADALAILNDSQPSQGGASHPKADLYKKMRGH